MINYVKVFRLVQFGEKHERSVERKNDKEKRDLFALF